MKIYAEKNKETDSVEIVLNYQELKKNSRFFKEIRR